MSVPSPGPEQVGWQVVDPDGNVVDSGGITMIVADEALLGQWIPDTTEGQ